jgi:hypothetical protein
MRLPSHSVYKMHANEHRLVHGGCNTCRRCVRRTDSLDVHSCLLFGFILYIIQVISMYARG